MLVSNPLLYILYKQYIVIECNSNFVSENVFPIPFQREILTMVCKTDQSSVTQNKRTSVLKSLPAQKIGLTKVMQIPHPPQVLVSESINVCVHGL